MKRILAIGLFVFAANAAHAQPNLLTNGDFELETPAFFYFDNNTGNTGTALDVPGWEAFANVDSSSWVQIAAQGADPSNWTLNLSGSDVTAPGFIGLAGIKTAAGSRAATAPGQGLKATVTYDNYFTPADISYFIDWFDAGGSLLSSTGGPLGDPNGALTYDPTGQLFSISGTAPALTAKAGVRFQSANGGFAGAEADNFGLAVVPEPSAIALVTVAGLASLARRRRG